MKFSKLIFLLNILFIFNLINSEQIITNRQVSQVGDNIARYILAKLMSYKYDLPFYYTPFRHSHLFSLDSIEKRIDMEKFKDFSQVEYANLNDVNHQKYENSNVILKPHLGVRIEPINPDWWKEIKRVIKFKHVPLVKSLPKNRMNIAVHIRKGNGGGQVYDGEQSSKQYFKFDEAQITYLNNYFNYPFDPAHYRRTKTGEIIDIKQNRVIKNEAKDKTFTDKVDRWMTKFPPEQFYVDQIIKVIKALKNSKLFIQIFTDDKKPYALIERLKKAINKPDLEFYFEDNSSLDFKDRIHQDLYNMSRFDGLIRSESYFPRISEIMGNHKFVIFPVDCKWFGKKLIMTHIAIKGSITN